MRITRGIVLSLLFLPGFAQVQNSRTKTLDQDSTFGAIRQTFLNQKVAIVGSVFDGLNGPSKGPALQDWSVARKNGDGHYEGDYSNYLPSTYHGRTAIVVAVQLKESKLRPNALGEIIQEDSVVNPYFDLVVQFDDGTTAICSGYPNTIDLDVTLEVEARAFAEQMSKQLPLLVGRNIYAVGYSKLYKADTSLDEMTGTGSLKQRLSTTDTPLLVPLKILAVKYIDATGVVLKVQLPNGSAALSFVGQNLIETLQSDNSVAGIHVRGATFFESATAGFLTQIPKSLTPREVEAIRHGTIIKGMSKEAATDLLGFPEKENDWGRGGKQLIFFQGAFLVYLDNQGKVTDWQSLDIK